MNARRVIGTLCLTCCCAQSALAAERHVPSEYPTIQAAINAAGAGDIVVIADGSPYSS